MIINGQEIKLNKNEVKEVQRIVRFKSVEGDETAQRMADIWMRSAPSTQAQNRRKAAVRGIGLSDEIKFL